MNADSYQAQVDKQMAAAKVETEEDLGKVEENSDSAANRQDRQLEVLHVRITKYYLRGTGNSCLAITSSHHC